MPALRRQVRWQQNGRARTPHPRMGRNADRRCRSVRVFGLQDIIATARQVASSKTYRDNPALVAMKVMDAAGMLIPIKSGPP